MTTSKGPDITQYINDQLTVETADGKLIDVAVEATINLDNTRLPSRKLSEQKLLSKFLETCGWEKPWSSY